MKVYILVSDTGSMLTKAIKMYTKDPYNHVSISLNKELTEMYSFGRKNVYNPFFGGFVNENVNSHLLIDAECEVYELEVTPEQHANIRNKLASFEKEREFYRYNFLGLIAVVLNIDFVRKYHYFCSQFVCSILAESTIKVTDKPFHYATPNDFRNYKNQVLLYKGNMKHYTYRSKELQPETPNFNLLNRVQNRVHNFLF